MSDGNSGREVSINTNSTITTTILVDNTGGIPVVATPTTTLADATAADEITTFTLVVDGTGPTLTTRTLTAGTDIALSVVGNSIVIDNAASGGGPGTIALESEGGAPATGEYALFSGADPQAAAATVSLKKIRSTSGTVSIADDGEFLDLSASLGPASGTITSLADSLTYGGQSLILYGAGPAAVLRLIRSSDSRIAVTGDANYIYIGLNYSLTNTIADSATSFGLLGGGGPAQYVRTLQPGTGISMTSDGLSVTISATSTSLDNIRIANNGISGNNATSSGSTSIAIGQPSNADAQAIAIGPNTVSRFQGVAIGASAAATTDSNVAVGYNAQATSTNCVAVGESASATAVNCTVVGQGSVASQNYCTMIGKGNSSSQINCILIGNDITNTEMNVLKVQTDGDRLLTAYGPNNPLGARTVTSGPIWSRSGNLKRYDRTDFIANVATLPATAIAPGNMVFISRGALTALGDLKLPNYASVLAMYGAVAPPNPGPQWWFRIVNNDGSNSCQITKQSATPDTYIYGQDGNDSGTGFGLGQTQMVAICAFLDTVNSKMKYSVMVKYG